MHISTHFTITSALTLTKQYDPSIRIYKYYYYSTTTRY